MTFTGGWFYGVVVYSHSVAVGCWLLLFTLGQLGVKSKRCTTQVKGRRLRFMV